MHGSAMTSNSRVRFLFVMLVSVLTVACQKSDTSTSQKSSAGSAQTQISQAWLEKSDARRGFIAAPTGQVKDSEGKVIWDFDAFAFVQGDAPASVNPSLWRQATLNNQIGLFKVTEGLCKQSDRRFCLEFD